MGFGNGLVTVFQSNLITIRNSVMITAAITQDWRPNLLQFLGLTNEKISIIHLHTLHFKLIFRAQFLTIKQ